MSCVKGTDAEDCDSEYDPDDCPCNWNAVNDDWWRPRCLSTDSKFKTLNDQECTLESDLGKCAVNDQEYGYVFPPDGSYKLEDERPANEICATASV